jgi:hypothetical protein
MNLDVSYASTTTMLLATMVLGVVMVATYLPARRAARLAVHSGAADWQLEAPRADRLEVKLPFTMTRDGGVGIFAFLHEYLAGHAESTSPDFRCADLAGRVEETDGKADETALVLRGQVWLAPYDMAVSQDLALTLADRGEGAVFGVRYLATRKTGQLATWHRANYLFIDLLRQQFLIFRALDEQQKADYVARAPTIFAPHEPEVAHA